MKKLVSLVLVLCLGVSLLGGISALADEAVTITYQYTGVIDVKPYVDEFVQQYKEKTGIDVTVELTQAPGDDWMDPLKTAVAAGAGPDIWHMDVNWLSAWKDVVIQPISDYLDPAVFEAYSTNGLDLWKADDKYYALPITFSVIAMMYNVDLAEEIGLDIKPGWTFADFEAALEKAAEYLADKTVTYTDGNEYPYVLLGTNHSMYYWWMLLGPFGGTSLDQTNNIAQKAFADGILKMAEWRSKGWIKRGAEVKPGNTMTAFANACNVMFWPTGDWNITGLTRLQLGIESDAMEVNVNFASVQSPAGADGKPHSEIYNQGVVMNKNISGEKAKAAAAFIQYLTNDAWEPLYGPASYNFCLPGRIDWMEQYPSWLPESKQGQGFLDTLANGVINSPDYQTGGIELTPCVYEAVEAAFRAVDEAGAFDSDAIYQIIVDELEKQQTLINVQLIENDIEPDNPDAKLK